MLTITECRSCGSTNLTNILSLGLQYPSNFIELNSISDKREQIPLQLIFCEKKDCGLLQLKHTASRESLYKKYWFRSGINEKMVEALKDITKSVEKRISLSENDIVLDIGCNDGTLLRSYQSKVRLVGFEPASNLVDEAKEGTDLIINNFFSFYEFVQHFPNERIKVITSIAMFYDLDDPNSFVEDVVNCLHSNGIWIIQMAYLIPMLKLNGFDNIGHEHLEYYSVKALNVLLEKHELKIFNVEKNDVYGGSIRAYITHKNNELFNVSSSVQNIIQEENDIGLDNISIYNEFANRVNKIKEKLFKFISDEVNKGKTVYVYGASTKGNTLLQFCNLDSKIIKKAIDRDERKIGKITIGTKIPIISEEQARIEKPDYFLVLPWHLINFFKEREKDYLKTGGKLIVPIPKVKIIEENSEYEI